jgi:hypothetical protein
MQTIPFVSVQRGPSPPERCPHRPLERDGVSLQREREKRARAGIRPGKNIAAPHLAPAMRAEFLHVRTGRLLQFLFRKVHDLQSMPPVHVEQAQRNGGPWRSTQQGGQMHARAFQTLFKPYSFHPLFQEASSPPGQEKGKGKKEKKASSSPLRDRFLEFWPSCTGR